jgi:hypothetical protein
VRDHPQRPLPNWIGLAIALAWPAVIVFVVAAYFTGTTSK